jgi:hypothetical protein
LPVRLIVEHRSLPTHFSRTEFGVFVVCSGRESKPLINDSAYGEDGRATHVQGARATERDLPPQWYFRMIDALSAEKRDIGAMSPRIHFSSHVT